MTSLDVLGDWPVHPIGELLERVSRAVVLDDAAEYREIGIRSHCKGIFHKTPTTAKDIGAKRVFWVEPGCFAFNIIFAWEQAIAVTSERERGMIASHRFPMFRSRNGNILPEYLYLYFSTPRGKYDLGIASPGGAGRNKTLGQQDFGRLKIPVPPLEVQREVVGVVRELDNAIKNCSQQAKAKRAILNGLMQQLLSGRRRFKDFGRTSRNGKVPNDWRSARLSQLGLPYTGLAGKSAADFGSGQPYIPYKNIFENTRIDPRHVDYVTIAPGERQSVVRIGDIFFTTSSETPEDVGTSSVLLDDIGTAYLNSFCFGFRLHSFDFLLPEYARFYFRGPSFRRTLHRLAQGATRYNLSKTQLLKTTICVPGTDEQRRIAEVLDAAERDMRASMQLIPIYREQKRGIMQQLLTGKVRVPVEQKEVAIA